MTEQRKGFAGADRAHETAGRRDGSPAEIAVVRTGLRVESIFTNGEVDPYDEVKWERRDVIQTNWKSGETVFEQRGVEFPDFWSVNASTIVATKYFRGALGTEDREWSLKQLIDRVVRTYGRAGREHSYFDSEQDARRFERELTWMLLHQVFSFNSPVWFNVGTPSPQQVSACFILSVDDTMESILNWYREEGLIFKGGSGAGLNLSRIRSSKELLRSSGGTASGPVSFMRGADASAGTIKSGGATRRAAKMVVLDVDHPDIEEFVETKAREEDKIRALRDAGFDMDLGGRDITSVQYQNANNSVRVSDEFMRAVEANGPFGLKARITGEVIETVDARSLFDKICEAAWSCADPGIQYDDTINDWHTNTESGRIMASNPCFTGDTLVATDKGLIAFTELLARANGGEQFQIWTHDATNENAPREATVLTSPDAYLITGVNPITRLRFSNGMEVRCTPGHKIFTANRGYVTAEDLTDDDEVRTVDQPTPAVNASWGLSISDSVLARRSHESTDAVSLPEEWSADLGHYLGWLVGDGCTSSGIVSTVYGTIDDRQEVLPRHLEFTAQLNGGRLPKVSEQANGTAQLRLTRRLHHRWITALGVHPVTAALKRAPASIFQAPVEVVAAFLQGLFDADGTVVADRDRGAYVGLASASRELLQDTQRLLTTFGIFSRIYQGRDARTEGAFSYTRKDGSVADYGQSASFDLRITGQSIDRFAAEIGFSLSRKQGLLRDLGSSRVRAAYETSTSVRLVDRTDECYQLTYNLSAARNHSYTANGIVVRNCSEYMSLDNSSCNLASLNLLKFLRDDGTFDSLRFARSVELIITAMDISICFADFPTESIGKTTREFRQLGIGYANLGALLMACGLAYDSEAGRALAAAITSLMTGTAYKRSAELAGVVGPYEGFALNAAAHARVMRKHAAASDSVRSFGVHDGDVLQSAAEAWDECLRIGSKNGWRNAQASVLAPTGCLTGDALVTTEHGLLRLSELGDIWGDKWQELELAVSTDEGPQSANRFFVNGEEPTRGVVTEGGYRIDGTLAHRVKVVLPESGTWEWKRLADVAVGDVLPIQLGVLVGQPRNVSLPVIDQAYYAGDRNVVVPELVDGELAELVGYFMGDGSLHAKGLRLCVADTDPDVVHRIGVLAKSLFNLEPVVRQAVGYQEVTLQSVGVARWWRAAGFSKDLPCADHSGKGWTPRVPTAIRESNDPVVYAAFLRGLFEADGSVADRVPSLSTASESFAAEVRTLLLVLGIPTTTRKTTSGGGGAEFQVRIRNLSHVSEFAQRVGFLSERKSVSLEDAVPVQSGNRDRIFLPNAVWDELAARLESSTGSQLRQAVRRGVGVSRDMAKQVLAATDDSRLSHALGFLFEVVAANEDGGVQPTYDLSVPTNVTYVANGFVSHNTIGFMMDCDTTGIEPDFSLVKFKKLVGGGSMQIVNQTIPVALRRLGYAEETVEAIVEHIAERGNVLDAPGLKPAHYSIFDCAMGARAIPPMGHVRMMAAVQPFLSGAISKTVNMPETATLAEVEEIYLAGWKLGLKALAIYRDNCKVGQPLSEAKVKPREEPEAEHRAVRKRLPKSRPARTVSFSVGGAEGYMTASSYPDNGLGEIFLKMSKQGSTLAGMMDAFSIAISIGLQYGVPIEQFVQKFTNMRFEPAGMTDDPDIRMAQSIMDYIFRRLALDFVPYDTRASIGIFTADERAAQVAAADYGSAGAGAGADGGAGAALGGSDRGAVAGVSEPAPSEPAASGGRPSPSGTTTAPSAGPAKSSMELLEAMQGKAADAPLCFTCGTKMRPSGSCYVCEGCGSTSGCS